MDNLREDEAYLVNVHYFIVILKIKHSIINILCLEHILFCIKKNIYYLIIIYRIER